jgi:DNA repair photolyase
VRVKVNVADVLRRELARRSWAGELVAIGAATDPYQPCEGRYALTRGCLEVLSEASNPISIITRGPMIVRDIDVLATAATRADVGVTFSIPTLDERIWRYTEPHTAPPRQRLRALKTLTDAGIDASVGIAPLLPGLSDDPGLIADVVKAARDHGATRVWANVLYLRPGTREHFMDKLAAVWPELVPMYERLYSGRAYLPDSEVGPRRKLVATLARQVGVADRRRIKLVPVGPPSPAEQLQLILSADAETRRAA